ncbi:MAG: lipopolysaccharide assembly protein LapB [Pseudomonadota bacterium]
MNPLLWFLLPVAATCGWLAARWTQRNRSEGDRGSGLRADYFKGIDYLLNDQQDKALDVFIQVLEVDASTAETHLALGSLYRRRGEVDRAIRIHQNLIERSAPNSTARVEALLELGQDYLSAGLLDRAEDLFRELVDGQHFEVQALRQLIDIYEQESDWRKAIEAAHDLERATGTALGAVIAQYWCELAARAREEGDLDAAEAHAGRALESDARCVRATLLQGHIWLARNDGRTAFECFCKVEEQDPAFLSEIIEPLRDAAGRADLIVPLVDYLRHVVSSHGGISATLALAELTEHELGKTEAAAFIAEQLRKRPSVRGFDRLMDLEIDNAPSDSREYAQTLKTLTTQLMSRRPIYKCSHCGFPARSMHWQCPGCKHWNAVKPIQGVEGE